MKVKLTATAVVKVAMTTTAYITTIVVPATAASSLTIFNISVHCGHAKYTLIYKCLFVYQNKDYRTSNERRRQTHGFQINSSYLLLFLLCVLEIFKRYCIILNSPRGTF